MTRGIGRSSAPPGEPTSSAADSFCPDAAIPWNVIVFDQQLSRLKTVCQIISEAGAQPRPIASRAALLSEHARDNCSLALVGLGPIPLSETPSLDSVRVLRQNGFKLFAYEDGLRQWPLVLRCRPLVAGATDLLDSSQQRFPAELQRKIREAGRIASNRSAEERRIKETMMRLGVVGESPPMIELFRSIMRISVLSDLPTLLTGETGTGKECLARAIYQLDPKRHSGPFIALNCGALNPALAESELFGHRRGAFTGAERDRKGLIRAAHGGVLFLDEIGELPEALQAKLLRVLQENRVLTLGEEHEVAVSVRVIAATNRNLIEMMQAGKFRADLFHRLSVLCLRIAPLRERPADILPLVQFFLAKHRMLKPKGSLAVTADFIEAIKQADLPGNVRQLENVICHALINKETDSLLGLSDLPIEIWRQLSEPQPSDVNCEIQMNCPTDALPDAKSARVIDYWSDLLRQSGGNLAQSLQSCERALLAVALRSTDGNQSRAARLLGITPRSVYTKVRKYQLL